MDNQPQPANQSPPTWAAFKKMGDAGAPSANPPSDYTFNTVGPSATPQSPTQSTSPDPPIQAASNPSPVPAQPENIDGDKDASFGSSIKNLLGFSKTNTPENTVPITPSVPQEITPAPIAPIYANSASSTGSLSTMPIPSFVPDASPQPEPQKPTDISPAPPEISSSPPTPAPIASADTIPDQAFSPLSGSAGPLTSLIESPPAKLQEITALPFPEANLPTNSPSIAPIPEPSPIIPIPSSPVSAPQSTSIPPAFQTVPETPPAAPSPLPPSEPQSSAPPPPQITPLPTTLTNPISETTPIPAAPFVPSPTPVAPASAAQLTPITPITPQPTTPVPATTPPTIQPPISPVASPPVSIPTMPTPMSQPAPISSVNPAPATTPTMPPPTQATPEPTPLSATPPEAAPTPQPAMQAPEFAPELAPAAPSLSSYQPTPQPAPVEESINNGFLGAPPPEATAQPAAAPAPATAPAVNFPGSQSPQIVSSTSDSSNGLRSIGDTSSNFDLLANPPGDEAHPAYLAPVTEAQPQQQPPAQVTTPAKPKSRFPIWAIIGGIAVALVALGVVAYFLISRSAGNGTNPSTLGASTVNQEILAASMGPGSWENDYSNSLLPVERGGLELDVTDLDSSSLPSSSQIRSLALTIAKAEVHLQTQNVVATQQNISATQAASQPVDRWETLRLASTDPINLMDLRRQGGASKSLGVTYLAGGRYSEMRLYLGYVTLITTDGHTYQLNLNSTNGIIKITKPFDVTTTGTIKLTADLNGPASVTNSAQNSYSFNPVLSRFLLGNNPL